MRLDAGERERKSRPRRWLGGGWAGASLLGGRSTDWERKFRPLRVQASGKDAKFRKDALIPLDAVQGCSLVVLNLADILIRAEPLATGLASDVHGKVCAGTHFVTSPD
ncbi:unnamed protein product [Prunus armeniaca]